MMMMTIMMMMKMMKMMIDTPVIATYGEKVLTQHTLFKMVDLPDPEGPHITNGRNKAVARVVKVIFL